MLSIFKSNPAKSLKKEYEKKLGEALQAQRSGDIKTFSKLTAEAEKIKEALLKLDPTALS